MRRMLRRLVLRHGKSQCAQVKTGKQRLPLTESNRCKCKVERIDQSSLQILPHGGNTASDLDVLVTRCLFGEPQRLFDSAGDKVESSSARSVSSPPLLTRMHHFVHVRRWPNLENVAITQRRMLRHEL